MFAFQFERVACAAKMPTNLIEDNCKLIPWVFFQIMYYDKQAPVYDNSKTLLRCKIFVIKIRSNIERSWV